MVRVFYFKYIEKEKGFHMKAFFDKKCLFR